MTNPELKNYIKVSLSKNIPKETIKSELLKVGWDTDVIEGAFNEVQNIDSSINTSISNNEQTLIKDHKEDKYPWLKSVGNKEFRIAFLVYVFLLILQSTFVISLSTYFQMDLSAPSFIIVIIINFWFLYKVAGRLKFMERSPFLAFLFLIPLFYLFMLFILLVSYEKGARQELDGSMVKGEDLELIKEKNNKKFRIAILSGLIFMILIPLVALGACLYLITGDFFAIFTFLSA